jgi:hypothetical protein
VAGFKALYCTVQHLETMLSKSAAFQELTGSADEAQALTRITMMSAEDAQSMVAPTSLPRAILWPLGSRQTWASTGSFKSIAPIIITIEMLIPSHVVKTFNAEFRYCAPIIESIIDEIITMSLTRNSGMLNLDEINVVSPPLPVEKDKAQGQRIWDCDIEVVAKG